MLFALSESVITISYNMAEIPRAFYGFLVLVDSPPKEQDFLLKVAKAFMLNDLSDHADLVGFDVADCTKGRPSLGYLVVSCVRASWLRYSTKWRHCSLYEKGSDKSQQGLGHGRG